MRDYFFKDKSGFIHIGVFNSASGVYLVSLLASQELANGRAAAMVVVLGRSPDRNAPNV